MFFLEVLHVCKKLKEEKRKNFIKRFIVWLAWIILKPKCEKCEEAQTCAYNSIMAKKED